MAATRGEPKRQLASRPEIPTPGRLIPALAHPVRRRILRALHEAEEARSPRELALALDQTLSNLSYHVRVLKDARALALTDSIPVRGSIESFYISALADDEWSRVVLNASRRHDESR